MSVPARTAKETVELTVATTGYSATVELGGRFGSSGKIKSVVLREDPTLDKATAAKAYVTDGEPESIDANTPDEAKVYESDSVTMAGGSAVTAEQIEATDGVYSLGFGERLKIALQVTAAAGPGASTKVYATVRAEVYR